MQTYDLVCIGSGPAGEKAATQAAYFGKSAAIIERNAHPGGAMVNTGTIPSKALRETALVCSAFHRRPIPGVDFNIDHTVSIPRLMARRLLIEQQEHDRIESSMDKHDVDVFRGTGRIEDPHTVVVEGADGTEQRLRAANILVATGSSPVRPGHVPFDHPGVVDADGVLELRMMPASMIIVGAGVIGCEYASIFAEFGVDVTVIDPRPDILPFLDAECRGHLIQAMREQNIDLRLQSKVAEVRPCGEAGATVVCESGDRFDAECLLWAAGRSSNTSGLGLEEAGVELGQRGLIVVDDTYRTNIPSIWAAGDVIGFPALAATSMEQGRIAACTMFGIDFKKKLTDLLPIGIYTIPGISMIGMMEKEAAEAGHETLTGRALYRYNARGRMLGDSAGIVKCVFDRESHRLLGATVVGEGATEQIHLAQAVIALGGGIEYFINACFNYPSLTELFKYAAYSALQDRARLEGSEDGRAARPAAA